MQKVLIRKQKQISIHKGVFAIKLFEAINKSPSKILEGVDYYSVYNDSINKPVNSDVRYYKPKLPRRTF